MHCKSRFALIAALGALLFGLGACGGGGATPDASVPTPGLSLSVLRDASGAPSGVRVSWTRVDVAGIDGYYIYRATSAAELPAGDPAGYDALRVNGGAVVAQSGTGTATLTFDDNFAALQGTEYFYRMTVVNGSHDESDFSNQRSIVIAGHTITSITTTPVGIGDQVTINGTLFGATRSGDQVLFMAHGGSVPDVPATTYVSWSDTQIVVEVPYGAADGPLGVLCGTLQVNSADSISYIEPALGTVTPNMDYMQHNEIVFSGTEFGPAPSAGGVASYVYFGSAPTQPADIVSWSETEIHCKVPAAAVGTNITVFVDVAGNQSNEQGFLLLPHITGLSQDSGPVGTTVTINGASFGAAMGAGEASVAGVPVAVASWSDTAVTLDIPAKATDGAILLTRDDGHQSNGALFDVVPVVSVLGPARRLEGEQLTILGSGFGTGQGASSVSFSGSVPGLMYTGWSETQITVLVPIGTLSGPVTVNIADASVGADLDSAVSAQNLVILLATPEITDIGQL